jgi:2-iminobutanoate/2-iminopropanoate deaminase
MTKTLITSDQSPPSLGPFSPALRVGDWLYLSGQGGFDPASGELVGDVAEQTEQTFRNIGYLLDAAGATFDDVVSCLVHLADLDDFATFNEGYARQLGEGVRPVRTTVRADLVAGMRVEITVVAHTGA